MFGLMIILENKSIDQLRNIKKSGCYFEIC